MQSDTTPAPGWYLIPHKPEPSFFRVFEQDGRFFGQAHTAVGGEDVANPFPLSGAMWRKMQGPLPEPGAEDRLDAARIALTELLLRWRADHNLTADEARQLVRAGAEDVAGARESEQG